MTLLAFHTHQRWSILLDSIRGEGSAGGERDEEAERGGELVVRELVRVAEGVDYGDEIGRRRMFELMSRLVPPFPLVSLIFISVHACIMSMTLSLSSDLLTC